MVQSEVIVCICGAGPTKARCPIIEHRRAYKRAHYERMFKDNGPYRKTTCECEDGIFDQYCPEVEHRKAYRNLWHKKRYHQRVEQGVCVSHGSVSVKPGHVYCEACLVSRAEQKRSARIRKPRGSRRNEHLKSKYKIGQADYDQMFIQQDGLCAACKRPPFPGKVLVVDHKHDQTQRVRGLLHSTCNSALGLVGEDPAILDGLISYLAYHTTVEMEGSVGK